MQDFDEADRMDVVAGDRILVIEGRAENFWWRGQNRRTGEIASFPREIVRLQRHLQCKLSLYPPNPPQRCCCRTRAAIYSKCLSFVETKIADTLKCIDCCSTWASPDLEHIRSVLCYRYWGWLVRVDIILYAPPSDTFVSVPVHFGGESLLVVVLKDEQCPLARACFLNQPKPDVFSTVLLLRFW